MAIAMTMDISKPILACDASYFVFYRYYAVKGWYKRSQEKDIDVQNVLQDDVFMDKYEKTFEKSLVELAKKYKVQHSNVVFAKDCSRGDIWRSAIYPSYKGTRDDKAASFNGDIFKYTYNDLFPKLQAKYGFHYLIHPRLEADDIIALLVMKVRDMKKTTRMVVLTNDNDYVQLYKYDIEIYNLQKKSLRDRIADVDNYLMYKIIVGDKSDNIKSIGKKIGDKTAQKMIADEALMNKTLAAKDVRETYELNKTLIDFHEIPQQYRSELYVDLMKLIT